MRGPTILSPSILFQNHSLRRLMCLTSSQTDWFYHVGPAGWAAPRSQVHSCTGGIKTHCQGIRGQVSQLAVAVSVWGQQAVALARPLARAMLWVPWPLAFSLPDTQGNSRERGGSSFLSPCVPESVCLPRGNRIEWRPPSPLLFQVRWPVAICVLSCWVYRVSVFRSQTTHC